MRLFTVKRLLGALVLVCITISTNANAKTCYSMNIGRSSKIKS